MSQAICAAWLRIRGLITITGTDNVVGLGFKDVEIRITTNEGEAFWF